jgi:hypothetical protein
MKTETIEIKREVWEYLRQFRYAPIKKRYLEKIEHEDIEKLTKRYKELFNL